MTLSFQANRAVSKVFMGVLVMNHLMAQCSHKLLEDHGEPQSRTKSRKGGGADPAISVPTLRCPRLHVR